MEKGEGINPFLTRIQEVQDSLSAIGAAPQPIELVRLALNSVSEKWQVFVQSILGRDKLPEWDKMWVDFQQEELRRALLKISINGSSSNGPKVVKEEENVALASKGSSQRQGEQRKKDLSKVKCFRCGELGHYNTQCPLRKKDKEEK